MNDELHKKVAVTARNTQRTILALPHYNTADALGANHSTRQNTRCCDTLVRSLLLLFLLLFLLLIFLYLIYISLSQKDKGYINSNTC